MGEVEYQGLGWWKEGAIVEQVLPKQGWQERSSDQGASWKSKDQGPGGWEQASDQGAINWGE